MGAGVSVPGTPVPGHDQTQRQPDLNANLPIPKHHPAAPSPAPLQ